MVEGQLMFTALQEATVIVAGNAIVWIGAGSLVAMLGLAILTPIFRLFRK